MTKYGNKKVELEGYTFDSMAEARRYRELTFMQKCKEIEELKVHPKYPLIVQGVKVCTYEGDFEYREALSKRVVTEDVKGVKTPLYQLKKKLMRAIHGIEIQEVMA